MKKGRFVFILIVMALVHAGASEPRPSGAAKPQNSRKTGNPNAVVGPQGFISDQVVNFFSGKTGAELMAMKKDKAPAKSAAGIAGASSSPKSVAPKSGKPTVPPPPATAPSVVAIRQEIQKILNMNRTIHGLNMNQVNQIQAVQGQARIHQKILDDLEASRPQTGGKAPNKQDLLAQEKLRIIHTETQRGAQMIEALEQVPPPAETKTDTKS